MKDHVANADALSHHCAVYDSTEAPPKMMPGFFSDSAHNATQKGPHSSFTCIQSPLSMPFIICMLPAAMSIQNFFKRFVVIQVGGSKGIAMTLQTAGCETEGPGAAGSTIDWSLCAHTIQYIQYSKLVSSAHCTGQVLLDPVDIVLHTSATAPLQNVLAPATGKWQSESDTVSCMLPHHGKDLLQDLSVHRHELASI